MTTQTGPAQLTIHDLDSAPADSKPILEKLAGKYGFTPALYSIFAGSPAVLKAYLQIAENFAATSLSNAEQQIVLLTVAVTNECHFCKAAHTWTSKGAGVSDEDVEAVRNGELPGDPRLAAVSRLAAHLVKERGFGSEAEISTFVEAGFERHQMMEVILGITLKTLSNYTNHLAQTPINEQLAPYA